MSIKRKNYNRDDYRRKDEDGDNREKSKKDDNSSVEELAKNLKKSHEKAIDAVKEIAEKALAEAEAGSEHQKDFREKADEAIELANQIKEQLSDMEQELAAAKTSGEPVAQKSIGEQFVESEDFKTLAKTQSKNLSASLSMKADITSALAGAGAAGAGVPVDRRPGVIELPSPRLYIRDLVAVLTTASNAVEYVVETGHTDNAGMVAEGAAPGESDITYDLLTETVKSVAHTMRVSKQILDDWPRLQGLIDGKMRQMLRKKENQQFLLGDNVGENLNGIAPQATAYAKPTGANDPDNEIDHLRLAILQATLADHQPNGIVLNPVNWANFELAKDANNLYMISSPTDGAVARMWRLPVVEESVQPVGDFLVGAFDTGAEINDREDIGVTLGFVNDDFKKRMITLLAESRTMIAVTVPEAFVSGTFPASYP